MPVAVSIKLYSCPYFRAQDHEQDKELRMTRVCKTSRHLQISLLGLGVPISMLLDDSWQSVGLSCV